MSRSFVVTGGARGVGGAIAERLSQEGAVVVVDRVAADGLGGGIRAIVGDAADDAVLGRAVQIAAAAAPSAAGSTTQRCSATPRSMRSRRARSWR